LIVTRINGKAKIGLAMLLSAAAWAGSAATAYNNPALYENLMRSRDALLTQKQHLNESADSIKQRINELQKQLDSVNQYISDTDNAVHDVDDALRRYGF
jgi:uncharacterized protein YlxW (UPF0749 family)